MSAKTSQVAPGECVLSAINPGSLVGAHLYFNRFVRNSSGRGRLGRPPVMQTQSES